jgi:NADPH:quinone reductase
MPGICAHHAVHVAADLVGRTVLVQGAAGLVGLCAVQLARHAGARVIGTVRSPSDEKIARKAGAKEVLSSDKGFIDRVKAIASDGVDHIAEVAFGANVEADVELLKQGGSIAAYATNVVTPHVLFWQMVFKNVQLFLLSSDDFPIDAKMRATQDLNSALEAGWSGFDIATTDSACGNCDSS